jgi:hypothetical protein
MEMNLSNNKGNLKPAGGMKHYHLYLLILFWFIEGVHDHSHNNAISSYFKEMNKDDINESISLVHDTLENVRNNFIHINTVLILHL